MNGEVIKTLAQYYANLNKRKTRMENPELCVNYETDTNGVTKEKSDSLKEVSSTANRQ